MLYSAYINSNVLSSCGILLLFPFFDEITIVFLRANNTIFINSETLLFRMNSQITDRHARARDFIIRKIMKKSQLEMSKIPASQFSNQLHKKPWVPMVTINSLPPYWNWHCEMTYLGYEKIILEMSKILTYQFSSRWQEKPCVRVVTIS